jgi:hypothetical protein
LLQVSEYAGECCCFCGSLWVSVFPSISSAFSNDDLSD